MHRTLLASILALTAGATFASGQVYTVTTLDDITDAIGVALPGPDGKVSFREAVNAANVTSGPQTIEFAIPESEFWLVDGVALLRLEEGIWNLTDDGTTVDFSSQTTNIGDTNPNGMEVGVYGLQPNGWGVYAIFISADDCVIKGMGEVHLRAGAVKILGSHNRVIGCVTDSVEIDQGFQGPSASFNIIGGIEPGEGNDLQFIDIVSWADDNIVIGNHIETINVLGSPFTTHPKRNRIGGTTPAERNIINGFGAYGEEGFPYGQGVRVEHAQDTLIEGNYIGTTEDGMDRFPQRGTAGVYVIDSIDTTIRNNLISGIRAVGVSHYAGQVFGTGIHIGAINEDNLGTVIQGNLIGTDATGANPILTHSGITVSPLNFAHHPLGTLIGGAEPQDANTIAFTETTGVSVASFVDGVTISGNSIHDNVALGIDLQTNSGVTEPNPNDPLDADAGGNGLQNFPIIDAATTAQIVGALSSAADSAYTLEFFASPACDDSGFGEGQLFLARATVTTDASGQAPFDVTLSTPAPSGWVVTATATDAASGSTSEFSPCVSVEGSACVGDLNHDGNLDFFDVSAFINAYGASDPAADLDGNGQFNFFDVSSFLNAFSAGCP